MDADLKDLIDRIASGHATEEDRRGVRQRCVDISKAVRACTHRSDYGRELASCCDIILYSILRVPGLAEMADPQPFSLAVRPDHTAIFMTVSSMYHCHAG